MNKVIISEEFNPYYNLALEEELLYSVDDEDIILYLWQNEKTVVIGRNQNPWLECNLDYLRGENIYLARRISGGGAVFHDIGNLNFTFITKKKNSNLEKQLEVLKQAISFFEVEISYSGRNDLLADGRKFSGHAFYEDDEYYFHHGTLMFDVDFKYLQKVLTPSKLKMESKGIQSVRSRVINLKELNPHITLENLKEYLINAFENVYGELDSVKAINRASYKPKKFESYQDEKWIYGETPKFDVLVEERTSKGLVQVALQVKDGCIDEVQVYSDLLETLPIEIIKQKIIGQYMDEEVIKNILKQII